MGGASGTPRGALPWRGARLTTRASGATVSLDALNTSATPRRRLARGRPSLSTRGHLCAWWTGCVLSRKARPGGGRLAQGGQKHTCTGFSTTGLDCEDTCQVLPAPRAQDCPQGRSGRTAPGADAQGALRVALAPAPLRGVQGGGAGREKPTQHCEGRACSDSRGDRGGCSSGSGQVPMDECPVASAPGFELAPEGTCSHLNKWLTWCETRVPLVLPSGVSPEIGRTWPPGLGDRRTPWSRLEKGEPEIVLCRWDHRAPS